MQFRGLLANALGLELKVFKLLFKENQRCEIKLFSYPNNSKIPKDASDATDVNQGVGPHRDSDFLTFIYQATDHIYLQVQTFNRE